MLETKITPKKIRSGKFDLHYTVEGAGIPTIVVGSSIYYPRIFSADLRSHLEMIFVDHRGFAPTTEETARTDFELDVVLDDIDLIRKHLGHEKIVILGHSGQGYMALEYAKRYPQHVSHVVMIGTGPSHSSVHTKLSERHWNESVCPERKKQLERDLEKLPAEIAAAPESRFMTFCLRLGAKSWYDYAFNAAPLWKDVRVNMVGIDYLWGEVFRDIDITRGLEQLEKPVLLALGKWDYLVAPYFSWDPYREKFRNLTVKTFDKSAHTPQLEESEAFNHELLQWISSQPSSKKGR